MIPSHFSIRRTSRVAAVVAAGAALVLSLGAAQLAGAGSAPRAGFTFNLVHTPGVACLPHAGGSVTITKGSLNDTMTISVHGLPAHTGFDLFVIQLPGKPFGIAWYQTDVQTGDSGKGTATVRGIFSRETFTVSIPDLTTTTVAPTHQFHLGLWFNSPTKPFALGCEGTATVPIITPFNGVQHAGIQILNTSNFPAGAGPLSHVH